MRLHQQYGWCYIKQHSLAYLVIISMVERTHIGDTDPLSPDGIMMLALKCGQENIEQQQQLGDRKQVKFLQHGKLGP